MKNRINLNGLFKTENKVVRHLKERQPYLVIKCITYVIEATVASTFYSSCHIIVAEA